MKRVVFHTLDFQSSDATSVGAFRTASYRRARNTTTGADGRTPVDRHVQPTDQRVAERGVIVGMAGEEVGLDQREIRQGALVDVGDELGEGHELFVEILLHLLGEWMAPVTEIGHGSST